MKRTLYLLSLLLFITNSLFSQITENFNDNNFTTNPEWIGSTEYFIVNTDLKLQSNGPDAETYFYLSTANIEINDTEWRFTINLDFNPTSSNFTRIYLVTDNSNLLSDNLNGYFIQLGQTKADYIKLKRQSRGTLSYEIAEIAVGKTAFTGDINVKIKVTREAGGNWKIYSASTDSENYILETSVTDNIHVNTTDFGFYCGYKTTSRRSQFYFDDIYIGEIISDTEKPYIQEFEAVTKSEIQIKFSELLDDAEALNINNYTLNNTINPQSVTYNSVNNQIVELNFANAFAEEITNTVSIENVADVAGNIMDLANYEFIYSPIKFIEIGVNTSTELILYFSKEVNPDYINTANFLLEGLTNPATVELLSDNKSIKLTFLNEFENNKQYSLNLEPITSFSGDEVEIPTINFTYHKAEIGDLVINEIMADPTPEVGLPVYEFIEIYNRSGYTISLKDWTLTANTSVKDIEHYNLHSGEYLIFCKEEAVAEFEVFGKTQALSTFPTLTNSGMLLKLKSNENSLISRVSYSEDWIESDLKRDGGWSMERIDPNNFCGEAENWKESEDSKGGTPGTENSILAENPDISKPEFVRLDLIAAESIEIFFSEIINFQSATELSNYSVDNNINSPIEIITEEDKPYSLILKFANTFVEKTTYILTINSNITDCAGNNLFETYTIRFAMAEKAESLDLIINEVLFNPFPEGSDFVELYNRSDKVIDLQSLLLTNRDEDGNLKTRIEIKESYLLFPEEYVVITSDKKNILENYTATNENAFAENDLPSMSDDEGNIVILNQNLEIIDEFSYTDDMHFALISTDDGISLERIDIEGETSDETNWHSAAENVGWATPTYENSAHNETPIADQNFSISPEVFSPNNDGYDDIVYISYKLEKAGYVANVSIYNSNGSLVNRIANNELLGVEGHFKWDGTYNEKEVAKMGIYIIFIELFDLDGNVKKYKKTCVLAKQF